MLRERNVAIYARRRILRIVPGFVVAFLLSFFVLAPVLGVNVWPHARNAIVNMVFLKAVPELPNEMKLHYASINGALWTIAYEFRCYVLVAFLWSIGLLERRKAIFALTAFGLTASLCLGSYSFRHMLAEPEKYRLLDLVFGQLVPDVAFFSTFLVGTTFYVFHDYLIRKVNIFSVLLSLLLATIAFQSKHFAEFARVALLAAPIFWVAFKADLGSAQRINDRWDISYGTYLYGWPVATAILLLNREIGPWRLAAASLPVAMLCGIASWKFVEEPAKRFGHRQSKS